jgi:hypothetical protein
MNTKKDLTKKHHYLPRYYLRGFTNEGGSFFVYDKQSDKIFATNPDASFFENDLNTVILPEGGTSDFLETAYTDIENDSWKSLDSVRVSTPNSSIHPIDKMHLFLFLLFLHWRLPSNVGFIEELSKDFFSGDNALDYFRLVSKTSEDVPKEVVERIKHSPAFKKSAKIIVPFAPFFKDNHWWKTLDKWQFAYSGDDKNWFIVGDNPIITRGNYDHDPVSCLKEFVFPVSGKILLLSVNRHLHGTLSPEFIIQYGTAIIQRAQRFVACQDKGFLEALIKDYKLHIQFDKTNIIITELFNMLDQTDNRS